MVLHQVHCARIPESQISTVTSPSQDSPSKRQKLSISPTKLKSDKPTQIFEEFWSEHKRVPNKDEKSQLAEISGKTEKQVSDWFYRRRKKEGINTNSSPPPAPSPAISATASTPSSVSNRNSIEGMDLSNHQLLALVQQRFSPADLQAMLSQLPSSSLNSQTTSVPSPIPSKSPSPLVKSESTSLQPDMPLQVPTSPSIPTTPTRPTPIARPATPSISPLPSFQSQTQFIPSSPPLIPSSPRVTGSQSGTLPPNTVISLDRDDEFDVNDLTQGRQPPQSQNNNNNNFTQSSQNETQTQIDMDSQATQMTEIFLTELQREELKTAFSQAKGKRNKWKWILENFPSFGDDGITPEILEGQWKLIEAKQKEQERAQAQEQRLLERMKKREQDLTDKWLLQASSYTPHYERTSTLRLSCPGTIVVLDEAFQKDEKAIEFKVCLNVYGVQFEFTKMPIPFSVQWKKIESKPLPSNTQESSVIVEDVGSEVQTQTQTRNLPVVVIRLDILEFADKVVNQEITHYVQLLRETYPNCTVALLIEGNKDRAHLNEINQSRQSQTRIRFHSGMLEQAMLYLQLECKIHIIESPLADITASILFSITRVLAIQREPVSYLSLFAPYEYHFEDTKVWEQQLLEIPGVSKDVARAISSAYPTCKDLLAIYFGSIFTEQQKEDALCECVVESGTTTDFSTRALGKDLSRKIYKFFSGEDGSELVTKPTAS